MKANSRCSLIAFAGAWRQVGHRDRQTALIGEALQFTLPEFYPRTVAATTVRGDRQTSGGGISRPAQLLPPAADTFDCKSPAIGIDADADPAMVGGDVIPVSVHPDGYARRVGVAAAREIKEIPAARPSTKSRCFGRLVS